MKIALYFIFAIGSVFPCFASDKDTANDSKWNRTMPVLILQAGGGGYGFIGVDVFSLLNRYSLVLSGGISQSKPQKYAYSANLKAGPVIPMPFQMNLCPQMQWTVSIGSQDHSMGVALGASMGGCRPIGKLFFLLDIGYLYGISTGGNLLLSGGIGI